MFVKAAEGFVDLPGRFGTLDELFESLTLIQTGKVAPLPGRALRLGLLEPDARLDPLAHLTEEMVSPEDLELLHVTDDAEDAVATIVDCYERRCASMPAEPRRPTRNSPPRRAGHLDRRGRPVNPVVGSVAVIVCIPTVRRTAPGRCAAQRLSLRSYKRPASSRPGRCLSAARFRGRGRRCSRRRRPRGR
jgi:hypothetical protein